MIGVLRAACSSLYDSPPSAVLSVEKNVVQLIRNTRKIFYVETFSSGLEESPLDEV